MEPSRGPGVMITVFLIAGSLALFLLFGKVFGFIGPETPQNAPQSTQTAQGAILATATIVIMDTPTITPTATQDAQATSAAMQMTAASDNVRAAGIEATAIIEAESIRATREWQSGQNQRAAIEAQATYTALEIQKQDAINRAAEIENERIQAEAQAGRNNALMVMAFSVGFLALAFIMYLGLIYLRTRQPEPGEDEPEEQEPQEFQPAGFMKSAPQQHKRADMPCTDRQFRIWATAMLAGAKAGINNWESAASPFTGEDYTEFAKWAEGRRLIAPDARNGNAKRLTAEGEAFCRDWLEKNANHN